MNRRRLFLMIALLALALAGSWFVWRIIPTEAERAYSRLRLGMAPSEVEAVVGSPPEDHSLPVALAFQLTNRRVTGVPFNAPAQRDDFWRLEDAALIVSYDNTGTAVGFYLLEADKPGLFALLVEMIQPRYKPSIP